MNRIKRFNEVDSNETLNESWKSWAVALGLVSASLFSNNVLGQSKLKDKIESVKDLVNDKINKDPILKDLEKEGYRPLDNYHTQKIIEKGKLVDLDISVLSNTQSAAKLNLISKLNDRKLNPQDGFFVYKNEGSNIRMKWITYDK
jgi:hypothetical protein